MGPGAALGQKAGEAAPASALLRTRRRVPSQALLRSTAGTCRTVCATADSGVGKQPQGQQVQRPRLSARSGRLGGPPSSAEFGLAPRLGVLLRTKRVTGRQVQTGPRLLQMAQVEGGGPRGVPKRGLEGPRNHQSGLPA